MYDLQNSLLFNDHGKSISNEKNFLFLQEKRVQNEKNNIHIPYLQFNRLVADVDDLGFEIDANCRKRIVVV